MNSEQININTIADKNLSPNYILKIEELNKDIENLDLDQEQRIKLIDSFLKVLQELPGRTPLNNIRVTGNTILPDSDHLINLAERTQPNLINIMREAERNGKTFLSPNLTRQQMLSSVGTGTAMQSGDLAQTLSSMEQKANYDRRDAKLNTTVIPNPHIDKRLLTRDELREVVAWALENQNADQPLQIPFGAVPDSAVEKLAAALGEMTYGENNYIGPGKSGGLGDLETVVTTVPALSEADARARAHDIGLAYTQSPHVDTVLPAAGRYAQVFRPFFHRSNGQSNYDRLRQAGDIEPNPGPLNDYDEKTAEKLAKLADNPLAATSNLNNQNGNLRVMDFSWYDKRGASSARWTFDNISDSVMHDNLMINLASITNSDVVGGNTAASAQMCTYVVNNRFVKATLTAGKLGAGLNVGLSVIDSFMAMQRTATNIVNGEAQLAMWSRMVFTDYGCYLGMAKLLCYEATRMPLHGCPTNMYRQDCQLRNDPAADKGANDWQYPNTDGNDPLVPAAVNAYFCTARTAAQILLGNAVLPVGFTFDADTTAWVVVNKGTPFRVNTYATLCHLEFPYGQAIQQMQNVSFSPGNGIPNVINANSRDFLTRTLVRGPKYNVMYVLTYDENTFFIDDGVGNATAIAQWFGVGVVPPATDISIDLMTYLRQQINASVDGKGTRDFQETFNYFAKWMDASDWRAACLLASNIINCYGSNTWQLTAVAGNSVGVAYNGTVPPTVDASVNAVTRNLALLNAANLSNLQTLLNGLPVWTGFGFPSSFSPGNASALGTGIPAPRTRTNINCFVQDTPWITKYGLAMDMLTKDVMTSPAHTMVTKAKMNNIFFAMRSMSELQIECFHNLVQRLGVRIVDMISPNTPRVVDRRLQVQKQIYASMADMHEKLLGYRAFSPQQWNDMTEPVQPVGLAGYWDWGSVRNAPIYVFNHFVNCCDKREEKFYPEIRVKYCMDREYFSPYFKPAGGMQNQNFVGIVQGGNASIKLSWGLTAKGKKEEPEKQTQGDVVKVIYAASKHIGLINPNCLNDAGNFFLVGEDGTLPEIERTSITSNYCFLRWTSPQSTSDIWRQKARGWLLWTMPTLPPEIDWTNGQNMTIGCSGQQNYTSERSGFDFSGYGSSNFAIIQNQVGLDGLLDKSSKYDF